MIDNIVHNNVWPQGKQFAFTVCDDTDLATVENVSRVYSFLNDIGLRTTKSCWPCSDDSQKGKYPGQTLADADYRQWILDLQAKGFEIGWHGSTWRGARRDRIIAAMEQFAEAFQHYPVVASNHTGAAEAMYWGSHRLTGWRRIAYNILTLYRNDHISGGHIEGDEYFWGDLCEKRIKYYRNFVFQDINTLKQCPMMPYHDPQKPFVNYWFASSNGRDAKAFIRCLSEKNQDRLEAEGGACIMYTHFANGFLQNGKLDSRFQELMTRLAKKNGWFVPVTTLLDHLLAVKGHCEITNDQRKRLERKWLVEKLFVGTV